MFFSRMRNVLDVAGFLMMAVGMSYFVVAVLTLMTGYKFGIMGTANITVAYLVASQAVVLQQVPTLPTWVRVVSWFLGICAVFSGLGAFLH